MDTTKQINVALPITMYQALQQRAGELSVKELKSVTVAEVLRRAADRYLGRSWTERGVEK
jgi:hypothetical protein